MIERNKNTIVRKSIIVICILLLGSIALFSLGKSYKPSVEAISALESNKVVSVTEDEFIIFTPKDINYKKGFIFYPGGKVDPKSYSMLCKKIAEEGYLVVIVPMPLDLAVLSPNRAEKVIEKFDDIEVWAIGGHSLGGVMACNYATKDSRIKGVALYASYPQEDVIEDSQLKVISIYGSEDGVADLNKIRNAKLPKDSKIIEVPGGNHANFGSYGEQKGDNKSNITEESQINKAAEYTVNLLKEL